MRTAPRPGTRRRADKASAPGAVPAILSSFQAKLTSIPHVAANSAPVRHGPGTLANRALTAEDNYATLTFVLPAAAGPDFERKLKALGARRAGGGGAVAVGADQSGFVVEIMLNP